MWVWLKNLSHDVRYLWECISICQLLLYLLYRLIMTYIVLWCPICSAFVLLIFDPYAIAQILPRNASIRDLRLSRRHNELELGIAQWPRGRGGHKGTIRIGNADSGEFRKAKVLSHDNAWHAGSQPLQFIPFAKEQDALGRNQEQVRFDGGRQFPHILLGRQAEAGKQDGPGKPTQIKKTWTRERYHKFP